MEIDLKTLPPPTENPDDSEEGEVDARNRLALIFKLLEKQHPDLVARVLQAEEKGMIDPET